MLLWFFVGLALSKAAHRRKPHWSLIMMSNAKHFLKAWLKISFYIWIAECLDWFSVIQWDIWFSQYSQQVSTSHRPVVLQLQSLEVHCLRHNNLINPVHNCWRSLIFCMLLMWEVGHRPAIRCCTVCTAYIGIIACPYCPKLPVAWQKTHEDGPMANRPPEECICFFICWTSSWTTLLVVLDCLHWSSQLL